MVSAMSGLWDILTLLAYLVAGALLARLRLAPKNTIVDRVVRYVLWALLLSMGFRIGNNPSLSENIGTMGLLAFATALLSVTGSCLAVYAASYVVPGLRRKESAAPQTARGAKSWSAMSRLRAFFAQLKAPLRLLAFVVAGLFLGLLTPPIAFDMGRVTGWTLNALLFLIGMQFVQSGLSLKQVLLNPAALALPFATIIGTLVASLALVPLFSLSVGKAMALAGGFGWYSLSGVLISNLGDPFLGSASFLANMFRESLALLIIPFLGRSRVPAMAVSAGGATAMDVTLPLIEQSTGPWIIPVSFMSGAVLSLVVPFLVPICFKLG